MENLGFIITELLIIHIHFGSSQPLVSIMIKMVVSLIRKRVSSHQQLYLKRTLTHSSKFLRPILSRFLLPQRYLLFLLNQCYDYWLCSFGFLNIRERDVSSTNTLVAKLSIFKRKKNILNILQLSLSLFKM